MMPNCPVDAESIVPKSERRVSIEQARLLFRAATVETLLLAPAATPTASKIGGLPDCAIGGDWPTWKGAPQQFLAQIDLAELHEVGGPDWLPEKGKLLFFYDRDQSTWGFDPADRGSWTVRHVPGDGPAAQPQGEARIPRRLGILDFLLRRDRQRDSGDAPFPERPIMFLPGASFPGPERLDLSHFNLANNEEEALFADYYAVCDEYRSRVGGHPEPIQNDNMELECQLASSGLYVGSPEGYQDPRAAALRDGAADWRLLLQLDSDDDLGMMWGDSGRLYFWVREADARAGRFESSWMVLQCC